jgi:hypothetical protein
LRGVKPAYESWPGMVVLALLYVPERIPPDKTSRVVSLSLRRARYLSRDIPRDGVTIDIDRRNSVPYKNSVPGRR